MPKAVQEAYDPPLRDTCVMSEDLRSRALPSPHESMVPKSQVLLRSPVPQRAPWAAPTTSANTLGMNGLIHTLPRLRSAPSLGPSSGEKVTLAGVC